MGLANDRCKEIRIVNSISGRRKLAGIPFDYSKPQAGSFPEPRPHERWFVFATLLAVALHVFLPSMSQAQALTGRASVVDGDTIEIRGNRVRLFGVDAVESSQRCALPDGTQWRCGRDAAFALDEFLTGQTVRCTVKDKDRYGRIVAQCSTAHGDVGAWLVNAGWAVAYTKYTGLYLGLEAEARKEGRGIWASEFIPPSEYRQRKRATGP